MKNFKLLAIVSILALAVKNNYALPNSQSLSESRDRVQNSLSNLFNLVMFQAQSHINPKTIWFNIDPNPNISSATSKSPIPGPDFILEMWEYLHSNANVPIITGMKMGKEIRNWNNNLHSFIFLAYTDSEGSYLNFFIDDLIRKGNRRRDRFIFTSYREEPLQEIFRLSQIIGLKEKVGFLMKDNIVLEDTKVFSSGSMERIKELSEVQVRPFIGGNLRGRHFKATGTLLPPWLYEISPPGLKPIEYDGSHYRIFAESSKKFNFTFDLFAPEGQSYGMLLPNGTWTGMVADLINTDRNFDLAILLGHVSIWYPLLDFAGPMGYANLVFVTANPQLEINWEAFFYPYQKLVWIGVTCVYFAIAFTMLVFIHARRSSIKSNDVHEYTTIQQIRYAFAVPFAIALDQNVKIPRCIRNLSALWMIAVIITGTGYKCNLASYLSLPTVTPGPSTYEELARDTNYQVYLNTLGAAEVTFFDTSDSPAIMEIRKRLGFVVDPAECGRKAFLNPKTACVSWTPLIYSFVYQSLTLNPRIEPLTVSKQAALPVSMSVAFQKDSIFVDAFTPITNYIFESGLYYKWENEAFYYSKVMGKRHVLKLGKDAPEYKKLKEMEDSSGIGGGFKPFTLKNVQFSFYVLGIGCLIAAMAMVIELCTWTMNSSMNNVKKMRKLYDDRLSNGDFKPVRIIVTGAKSQH